MMVTDVFIVSKYSLCLLVVMKERIAEDCLNGLGPLK